MNFGNLLNYDMPAALNVNLKTSLGIDDQGMAMLYSVYSFPNCVMVILGGVLVDRVGLVRAYIKIHISIIQFIYY